MKILKLLLIFILVNFSVFAQEQFKFKFDKKITLDMNVVLDTDMKMYIGDKYQNQKNTNDVSQKIDIEPISKNGNVTKVKIIPYDISSKLKMIDASGILNVFLEKDGSLNVFKNAQEIINTKKKLGLKEAVAFKNGVMASYIDGEMEFDDIGNTVSIGGSVPFKEHWSDMLDAQIGFFGIAFPEKPIAVNESWNHPVSIKRLNNILLGNEIVVNVKFTRLENKNNNIIFKIEGPFNIKNIPASVDNLGRLTPMNIDVFKRDFTGLIEFDEKNGIVISQNVDVYAYAKINANYQNSSLKMEMIVKLKSNLKSI